MLLQEGTSKGNEPNVMVLEISRSKKRQPDDLLPYLPTFATLFRPLPTKESELILKTAFIPLSDIECLTKAVVTIPETVQNIKRRKEALVLARNQFVPLCHSWNLKGWEENDWSRIRDLNFREILEARKKEGEEATNRACLQCPNFLEHFAMEHDEWIIKENILQLRQLMSDQNLQLLPDYEQRILVLKDLGFVDESSRVELKGKVACEVRTLGCFNLSFLLILVLRFILLMNSCSLSLSLRTCWPSTSLKKS
jgi:antiviral helicase SKI2